MHNFMLDLCLESCKETGSSRTRPSQPRFKTHAMRDEADDGEMGNPHDNVLLLPLCLLPGDRDLSCVILCRLPSTLTRKTQALLSAQKVLSRA